MQTLAAKAGRSLDPAGSAARRAAEFSTAHEGALLLVMGVFAFMTLAGAVFGSAAIAAMGAAGAAIAMIPFAVTSMIRKGGEI